MGRSELLAAFRDLAAGRGVRRGRHDLHVEGEDGPALFRQALAEEGFRCATVREAEVERGERAAAFLIRGETADFGWVFWEKFTETRSRKLFGSVVRNAKGDWAIQLGRGSREPVWIHPERRPVDPDRPTGFGS